MVRSVPRRPRRRVPARLAASTATSRKGSAMTFQSVAHAWIDSRATLPRGNPMRIVVMGSGGTGGYFGAKLARAGEDVTFVARGAHLEAIRTRGLRVRSAPD